MYFKSLDHIKRVVCTLVNYFRVRSSPFTVTHSRLQRVLRTSRTHPKMKLLNRPSIAFIDYVSYRQLIDRRLIVDIPTLCSFKICSNFNSCLVYSNHQH